MSGISTSSPIEAKVTKPRRKARRTGPPNRATMTLLQLGLLVVLFALWWLLVRINILPVFFFGDPILVLAQMAEWCRTGEVFIHLATTLAETILAFIVGVLTGVGGGLWLGLSPLTAALLDPYIKALNAMPRVILGPIFIVWFGLGIWSKVALGVTLVFFVVFFNVFQGVREVNPVILANARMLGANRSQLLRTVYIPSAMSWVFSSLHMSVGMAFVGAVVGEYLGSAQGIGYLILQAEANFDVNAVFAGMLVLTIFALLLDTSVTILEKKLIVGRPN
jgi:NitT/TauT family transport system permease protein